MATPADNLSRIADLSGEIRDFVYTSSNSLSFIDESIISLSQEMNRNFSNANGYLANIYGKLIELIEAVKKIGTKEIEKKKVKGEGKKGDEKDSSEKNKGNKNDGESKSGKNKDLNKKIDELVKKGGEAGSMFQYLDETGKGFALLTDGMLTASSALSAIGVGVTAAGAAFAAASLAVAFAPKIFMNLIDTVSSFVKALDPGLMAQLSLAMSDLQATIGVGLRPIIQAAIPIIRAFADTLMPLMNQLAPVIQQFGNSMLKIAVPVIAIWADAISLLIPIIESIIPLFVDLSEILMILTPVFSFLFETLYRSVNFVIGIFHSFMVGLKAMTVAVLEAGAWLVSWVSKSKSEALKAMAEEAKSSMGRSMEAQAQAFGKALGDRPARAAYTPGASVGAAAKQASYSGIADLGKNMMQAAFGQSAQNAALQTADNTKVMADGFGKLVGWIMGQGKPNAPQQGVR